MTNAGDERAPLILTLALDQATHERLDTLRRAHFPPQRNHLPAHLTLFHHLPGEHAGEIEAAIAADCGAQGPVALTAAPPVLLGRGVAYPFVAPALLALRTRLAAVWEPWLTPQDRQPFRPHVTVQNKVSPAEARALYDALRARFTPFEATSEGLLLWWYRSGPWEPAARYPFGGAG